MIEFGRLIHIDGMPRAGKSTALLSAWTEIEARTTSPSGKVVLTREPGGTDLANVLRPIILNGKLGLSSLEEAHLFATARVSNNERVVIPARQKGDDVFKDRCVEASFSFQASGRGLSLETVRSINQVAVMDLQPRLTVIFDVSVETLLNRAGDDSDKFESMGADFLNRVRDRYLSLRKVPDYRIINGEQPPEKVRLDFLASLEEFGLLSHQKSP